VLSSQTARAIMISVASPVLLLFLDSGSFAQRIDCFCFISLDQNHASTIQPAGCVSQAERNFLRFTALCDLMNANQYAACLNRQTHGNQYGARFKCKDTCAVSRLICLQSLCGHTANAIAMLILGPFASGREFVTWVLNGAICYSVSLFVGGKRCCIAV